MNSRRMYEITRRPTMKIPITPMFSHRPSVILGKSVCTLLQLQNWFVFTFKQDQFPRNQLLTQAAKENWNMEVFRSHNMKSGTCEEQNPATSMKGITRIVMSADTTSQFLKTTPKKSPNELLLKVVIREMKQKVKNLSASIVRLQAKQVIRANIVEIKIYNGTQARERAKQYLLVEQRLESLQRMKVPLWRVKTPTLPMVPMKQMVMLMKKRAPSTLRQLTKISLLFQQYKIEQKIDWNTAWMIFNLRSSGFLIYVLIDRVKISEKAVQQDAFCQPLSFSSLVDRVQDALRLPFSQYFLKSWTLQWQLRSISSSVQVKVLENPSLLRIFRQKSQGFVKGGSLYPICSNIRLVLFFYPEYIIYPSHIRISCSNSQNSYEEGWWMVDTIEHPSLARSFAKSMMLQAVVESRPVVGQSMNRILGLTSSQHPIAVLFFQPPLMPLMILFPMQVSAHLLSPSFQMVCQTLSSLSCSESSGILRLMTNLKASRGVRVGMSRSSWLTNPILFPCSFTSYIFQEFTNIYPQVLTLSATYLPDRMLSSVVFPHPDGPISAINDPGGMFPDREWIISWWSWSCTTAEMLRKVSSMGLSSALGARSQLVFSQFIQFYM